MKILIKIGLGVFGLGLFFSLTPQISEASTLGPCYGPGASWQIRIIQIRNYGYDPCAYTHGSAYQRNPFSYRPYNFYNSGFQAQGQFSLGFPPIGGHRFGYQGMALGQAGAGLIRGLGEGLFGLFGNLSSGSSSKKSKKYKSKSKSKSKAKSKAKAKAEAEAKAESKASPPVSAPKSKAKKSPPPTINPANVSGLAKGDGKEDKKKGRPVHGRGWSFKTPKPKPKLKNNNPCPDGNPNCAPNQMILGEKKSGEDTSIEDEKNTLEGQVCTGDCQTGDNSKGKIPTIERHKEIIEAPLKCGPIEISDEKLTEEQKKLALCIQRSQSQTTNVGGSSFYYCKEPSSTNPEKNNNNCEEHTYGNKTAKAFTKAAECLEFEEKDKKSFLKLINHESGFHVNLVGSDGGSTGLGQIYVGEGQHIYGDLLKDKKLKNLKCGGSNLLNLPPTNDPKAKCFLMASNGNPKKSLILAMRAYQLFKRYSKANIQSTRITSKNCRKHINDHSAEKINEILQSLTLLSYNKGSGNAFALLCAYMDSKPKSFNSIEFANYINQNQTSNTRGRPIGDAEGHLIKVLKGSLKKLKQRKGGEPCKGIIY